MTTSLQAAAFISHAKNTLSREVLAEVWVGLTKALDLSLFVVEGGAHRETVVRLAPAPEVARWVKSSAEAMLTVYGQLADGAPYPPEHWSVAVDALFLEAYRNAPYYHVEEIYEARAGYLMSTTGSGSELDLRLGALAADVCARPEYIADAANCDFDQAQAWALAPMACGRLLPRCSCGCGYGAVAAGGDCTGGDCTGGDSAGDAA